MRSKLRHGNDFFFVRIFGPDKGMKPIWLNWPDFWGEKVFECRIKDEVVV